MVGLIGFACAVFAFLSFIGAFGLGIESEREESGTKAFVAGAMGVVFGVLALYLAWLAGKWAA